MKRKMMEARKKRMKMMKEEDEEERDEDDRDDEGKKRGEVTSSILLRKISGPGRIPTNERNGSVGVVCMYVCMLDGTGFNYPIV